ncbi:MAG: M15 family metallopeptidase [Gammaproteobacteria bacterium]
MQAPNFLLISDPRIWAIPVQECHEGMIDVRELNLEINNKRSMYYDRYTEVRESVAMRLAQAIDFLPNGYTILFSEGHRPIDLQEQMYNEYYAELASAHPDWSEETLYQETTMFIASPEDVPPHSTGGAIDLTLLDENGMELDMGSPLDEAPNKNEQRNFTFAQNVSDQAKANRKILFDAMTKAGFVNYPAEWWHWSYGDKYWAQHVKSPHAIYGSVG